MRSLASLGLLAIIAYSPASGGTGAPQPQAGAQTTPSSVRLELRAGNGNTKFHLGEIVPVELRFSTAEHRKYQVTSDCFQHQTYHYNIEPPAFVDRVVDVDAGMSIAEMTCGGPFWEIDLAAKPFTVNQTLNERFRIDKPGKYKISVTSSKFGGPVTSNVVEIEILPKDETWETAEATRALQLMGAGGPKQEQGCRILSYLGTGTANIEMARHYSEKGGCDRIFELPLIASKNRAEVLSVLENGISSPRQAISAGYLRTLAIVSLYQQHPDWYPADPTYKEQSAPEFVYAMRSGLWRQRGSLQNEELRYARLLAVVLPRKDPEPRSRCLLTLLNLGMTLAPFEIPDDIQKSVREQFPSVFTMLPPLDQDSALKLAWPDLQSPAMVPVLKEIIEQQKSGIALRRLYEISPAEARPYILGELSSTYPHFGADVLGLLPDKELPELDEIMLQRVLAKQGDVSLITNTGLLQRYASPAIAKSLLPFLNARIGSMECQSEANLLSYFLRVDPQQGARMLHNELQIPARPGCLILRRLAAVRMSPEVEQEALVSLNDPNPAVVHDASLVLRDFGSSKCKAALMENFRAWHKEWQPRTKELENAAGNNRTDTDSAYIDAVGGAQAWFTSNEDWKELRALCLTAPCREEADRHLNDLSRWTFNERGRDGYMVGIAAPAGNEATARFVLGGCCAVADMTRLKAKITQYPKGSIFRLDSRSVNSSTLRRIYAELQPWAVEHGFEIQVYPDDRVQ